MSNPFFSIVIPVYNTEDLLERCVAGITDQTFSDFEVLLVNDGSKDKSGEIIDRLSSEDDRIKGIHKENGGAPDARNAGVKAAIGKYLMFVDSDDLWDDNTALEELHGLIQSNEVDVVCFGTSIYDEDGTLVKMRKPEASNGTDKLSVLRPLIYTNQYFSASYVKAVKREYFERENLYFTKGLLSGEDIEWSSRVMVTCDSISVFPRAFYKRIRRNEGSITSAIGKKNVMDVLKVIEQGINHVDERAENAELKELYYEYWTYQYAMLLGLTQVMRDDPEFDSVVSKLKEYRWLLKYDHVKKVRLVHRLVDLVGVRKAIWVLSKYYRV